MNCGRTGLTEEQAKAAGYEVVTALSIMDDKAHYYPDASSFITKVIADRNTHKLLGIQVLGSGAVDKMVDIAVMGINMGAVLEDFENADFAYAPPFSTAIHPLVQSVCVLINKINGVIETMTPAEYAAGKAKDYRILDTAPQPTVRGAQYIDPGKRRTGGNRQGRKTAACLCKGKERLLLTEPLKALRIHQYPCAGGRRHFQ